MGILKFLNICLTDVNLNKRRYTQVRFVSLNGIGLRVNSKVKGFVMNDNNTFSFSFMFFLTKNFFFHYLQKKTIDCLIDQ